MNIYRSHVLICGGTGCTSSGSVALQEEFENRLKENNLEKLVNVYAVLSNEDCNIALIFHRTQTKTDVYLAVINTANDASNTKANEYQNRLQRC